MKPGEDRARPGEDGRGPDEDNGVRRRRKDTFVFVGYDSYHMKA